MFIKVYHDSTPKSTEHKKGRETFTKVCPAGKTTAVVEGEALTARDILRPPVVNIRSVKPPRRAHK